MTPPNLTRRKVLASLGAVGVGSAGLRLATEDAVAMTHSTTIENPEAPFDLQLEWRESYNGSIVEGEDFPGTGTVNDPDGPVLSLDDVKPGDSGSLTVRLSLVDTDSESSSDARLFMSLGDDWYTTAENDVNEPEEKAGDTTESEGELQDHVNVSIWYDSGIFRELPLPTGACNGQRDPNESLIVPESGGGGTVGTIDEVVLALESRFPGGVPIDPTGSLPETGENHECISVGESICISLEWALPIGTGNLVQTDGVGFDLGFRAEECSPDG